MEFTDREITELRQLLTAHYGDEVEIQLADCALAAPESTEHRCPTIFWHREEANFVVSKTGKQIYRARFFFTPHEQYETDAAEYASLSTCVRAVLNARSDYCRA